MSNLNANATEWRPTGSVMLDLTLPPATTEATARISSAVSSTGGRSTSSFHPQRPFCHTEFYEVEEAPPAYYPSFMLDHNGIPSVGGEGHPVLEALDWTAEYNKVMDLTAKMIEQQLNPAVEEAPVTSGATTSTGPVAATPAATVASVTPTVGEAYGAVVSPKPVTHHLGIPDDSQLPPLTAKGNRRWKKPTKAQQRRDQSQRSAFEAFASALLHSVSPFMAPLRAKCRTSLPHLKLDQRFGKNGQPQTAVAQFIVAPLVTNYRPRHFHDLTPGDLMEYHYDLAQVLRQIKSSYALILGYGPIWKRYAVPYCFIACREYRQEVLALCPDEIPNSRSEAIYEDDIIKNITDVVLSVEELEPLQQMSILQAMGRRVNLSPLYDVLDTVFAPIENYQVEIWDLEAVPSTFVLKTSRLEVEQKPQPIVLYGDENLWQELPVVSRVVVQGGGGAGDGATTSSVTAGGDVKRSSALTATSLPAVPTQRIGRQDPVTVDAIAASASTSRGGAGNTKKAAKRTLPLLTLLPLALSVACVAATVGIFLRKKQSC